jgi:hypothetical protein
MSIVSKLLQWGQTIFRRGVHTAAGIMVVSVILTVANSLVPFVGLSGPALVSSRNLLFDTAWKPNQITMDVQLGEVVESYYVPIGRMEVTSGIPWRCFSGGSVISQNILGNDFRFDGRDGRLLLFPLERVHLWPLAGNVVAVLLVSGLTVLIARRLRPRSGRKPAGSTVYTPPTPTSPSRPTT